MARTLCVSAVTCAVIYLGAAPASADVSAFSMMDHPGGEVAPPFYGLRADHIFGNGRVNTFSIDTFADSVITITDNGGNLSIHMAGTLWGGGDGGAAHVNPKQYTYEFDFTEGVEVFGDGWRVVGLHDANGGFLDEVGGDFFMPLGTRVDNQSIAFVFAPDGFGIDGDDSTWVGRGGVLTPDPDGTGSTQEWLFTAIPAPGTLGVALGGGLLTLPRRRRR